MPEGRSNYLVGSHPDKWRMGVPLYGKIIYSGIYPGIDLIYYGNQNQLEYDFVVAPGASWRSIRLAFSGAQAVAIDANGDLKLQTRGGWVRHRRPRVYQQLASGRSEISGHYVLQGNGQVGFAIGIYDPAVPLVIDPVGSISPMHCTIVESLAQVMSSWTASKAPVAGMPPSALSSKVFNGSPPGTVEEETSISNRRTVPLPALLVHAGAGGATTLPTIDAPSSSDKVKLAGVPSVPNTKVPDCPLGVVM